MNQARMIAGGRMGLVTVAVLALASTSSLQAQVGLSSGVAQVALVVRVAPGASIASVSPAREIRAQDQVREAAVSVRYSVNSSYRLVVRSSNAHPTSRVWVRATNGEYQEVVAGIAVTVARGAHSAGQLDREVSYRIGSGAVGGSLELPVRYEIVVDPTI